MSLKDRWVILDVHLQKNYFLRSEYSRKLNVKPFKRIANNGLEERDYSKEVPRVA